jgi:hypothetical protein
MLETERDTLPLHLRRILTDTQQAQLHRASSIVSSSLLRKTWDRLLKRTNNQTKNFSQMKTKIHVVEGE